MEKIIQTKEKVLHFDIANFIDYVKLESSNALFLITKTLEEIITNFLLFYPNLGLKHFAFFASISLFLILNLFLRKIFFREEKSRARIIANLKIITAAIFILALPTLVFVSGLVVRGWGSYRLDYYLAQNKDVNIEKNLQEIRKIIDRRQENIFDLDSKKYLSPSQKVSFIKANKDQFMALKNKDEAEFIMSALDLVAIDTYGSYLALEGVFDNQEIRNATFFPSLDIYLQENLQADINFPALKNSPVTKELDSFFSKKYKNFLWAEKNFSTWKKNLLQDKEKINTLKQDLEKQIAQADKEIIKKHQISFLGIINFGRNFLVREEVRDANIWIFFQNRDQLDLDSFFGILGFISLCFLSLIFVWRVFYIYFVLFISPFQVIQLATREVLYLDSFLKKQENFIFYLLSPILSIFLLMILSIFTVEVIKSPFFVLIFLSIAIFISHDAFMHFMKKKFQREKMMAFWKYRFMPKMFDLATVMHIRVTGKEIIEDRVEVLQEGLKVHDHLKEKFKIAKEKVQAEAEKNELNPENYIRNKTHLHTVVDEVVDSNIDKHSRRMKEELSSAAKVQSAVLDIKLPEINGLDIFIKSNPASEIGGDCYDFIEVDKDNYLFYVGDATGHGAPAALVVSSTSTLIQTYTEVYRDHADMLLEVLVQSNKILHKKTTPDMFITLLACQWKISEKEFSYVSAGHERIILFSAREQKSSLLPPSGMALGMLPELRNILKRESINLSEGDVLAIYSDGIPEAKTSSDEHEMYGMTRFQRTFEMACKESSTAGDIYDDILTDLNDFTEGRAQADDVTLMIIKRTDQVIDEPTASEAEKTITEIPSEIGPEKEKHLHELEEEIEEIPVISVESNLVTEEEKTEESDSAESNTDKDDLGEDELDEDEEDGLHNLGQTNFVHPEEESDELPKIKMPTKLMHDKQAQAQASPPDAALSDQGAEVTDSPPAQIAQEEVPESIPNSAEAEIATSSSVEEENQEVASNLETETKSSLAPEEMGQATEQAENNSGENEGTEDDLTMI